ncbi:MAG: Ig-like domain-containing protein [Gemmatimonadales bacterium]
MIETVSDGKRRSDDPQPMAGADVGSISHERLLVSAAARTGCEPCFSPEIHVELTVEREHAHRGRRVRWTVLLIALLASCKESTAPAAAAAPKVASVATSMVAIGGKDVIDTVGATVLLSVVVAAADGKPVSGVPVSFSLKASGGSISHTAMLTDEAGTANTLWTLSTIAGSCCDEVIAASEPFPAIVFFATTQAGAAAALKVSSGDSQVGFFSLAVPVRPTVTEIDRFGNAVLFSATGIKFAVSNGGGSFSGGCCTAGASPDSNYPIQVQPTDDWLLGNASTTQTLTATAPGLAPVTIRATATAAPLPSGADWAQVAAQFAAIAVDAFEQATASPSVAAKLGRVGGGMLSSRQQPARAAAQLNIAPTSTASYVCCNPFATGTTVFARSVGAVNVATQTTTTLDAGGSGSIALTETITEAVAPTNATCIVNCDLPFTATHALALPSPGLTVSAVVSVVNGVVGAVQQLHLTGSVDYYSGASGSSHASSADVTLAYNDFPRQPVSPTGQFGVALSSLALPNVAAPNRADLPAYPSLMSTTAVGVQEQYDYFGPPGTTNFTPTGLFWTDLFCPGPWLTATGGDMSNVTVTGSVVWPSISPDYVPIPLPMPTQVDLAAGQSLHLESGDANEVQADVLWGYLGAQASGTRTPWNVIYQVSYTVKSTGQKAMYSLAYSCK